MNPLSQSVTFNGSKRIQSYDNTSQRDKKSFMAVVIQYHWCYCERTTIVHRFHKHLNKLLFFCSKYVRIGTEFSSFPGSIAFFFQNEKTCGLAEAHRIISDTYGKTVISGRRCWREWFQRFMSGDFAVEDRHSGGRVEKAVEDAELEASDS
nr:Mariner Mos1 transposase [Hymenolepis microstoma]